MEHKVIAINLKTASEYPTYDARRITQNVLMNHSAQKERFSPPLAVLVLPVDQQVASSVNRSKIAHRLTRKGRHIKIEYAAHHLEEVAHPVLKIPTFRAVHFF